MQRQNRCSVLRCAFFLSCLCKTHTRVFEFHRIINYIIFKSLWRMVRNLRKVAPSCKTMNYPYKVLISYVNSDGVIFKKILRDIHDYKEFGKLSSDLSAALKYCSGCRGYSFLTEFIYPKKCAYYLFKDSDFQVYD